MFYDGFDSSYVLVCVGVCVYACECVCHFWYFITTLYHRNLEGLWWRALKLSKLVSLPHEVTLLSLSSLPSHYVSVTWLNSCHSNRPIIIFPERLARDLFFITSMTLHVLKFQYLHSFIQINILLYWVIKLHFLT